MKTLWEKQDMDRLKRLTQKMKALPEAEQALPQNLLRYGSAYAAYDAVCQKSLEAGHIARLFTEARKRPGGEGICDGAYMAALADTVEQMDIQIYEHYRCLADLLLEAAQAFVRSEGRQDPLAVYAVLKGIRLGLLDEERYLEPAFDAFCRLPADGEAYAMAAEEHRRAAL
ncbi:MAG: hypothetical protein IJ573_03170 [Clostridia bacterium]|nr:hypothetical protein [Clostridia bacterium]